MSFYCRNEARDQREKRCAVQCPECACSPGFVPAKVYMDGPEFLTWLREVWEGGRAVGIWEVAEWPKPAPRPDTFEKWLAERLGTDSVPAETPESPNR